MSGGARRRRLLALSGVLLAALLPGCVLVPQNRRARLADPMMAFGDDSTEAQRRQKFHGSREGAAGGDGAPAGGGCGCQ